MAIKIKNVKKYSKFKKNSKYKMSGSAMPGKWRQRAYTATTFSHGTKKGLKTAAKIASVGYYPLKYIGKMLTYLPKKIKSEYINNKTKSFNELTGERLTFKQAYGVKNKSYVKNAVKALAEHKLARDKLDAKYGRKTVAMYNVNTKRFEAQEMSIMERYVQAQEIIKLNPADHPGIINHLAKAKLLINFVNKKLRNSDQKTQKILNYIKKRQKKIVGSVNLKRNELKNKTVLAADKIKDYIYGIQNQEHIT